LRVRLTLGGGRQHAFRAVQAMFCTKLGAPCSLLQKAAHLKPRVTPKKQHGRRNERCSRTVPRVDGSTGSGRNVRNQCLLALLICEKCSLGAIRCDAMQTVCRGLTNAVGLVLTVSACDIGTDRGLQGDKVPPNWLGPNSGTIGVFTGFCRGYSSYREAWNTGVRSGCCW
jgi:hypothetical protein